MSFSLIAVIVILLVLLIIGAPVIFSLGASAVFYFLSTSSGMAMIQAFVNRFFLGIDNYVLLCIPLYCFAGDIMGRSGLMDGLISFCDLLVGRVRGGMAYVNVLGSMIFAGIQGSALADITALGPIEIEMMTKSGYDRDYSCALTAVSAVLGPIIPPSVVIIMFCSVVSNSVVSMFAAAIVPGILMGLAMCVIITIEARIHNFPRREHKYTLTEATGILKSSLFAIVMPLIIVGGILSGFFTPTEAGAVAVAYALIVAALVYKQLSLKMVFECLESAIKNTSSIYLIIGFTYVISWIMAMERVPAMISSVVAGSNLSLYTLLFLVNIFFLVNGCWLSDTAQIMLFAPIFLPVFVELGMSPVHMGVVMCVNVMIGLVTPPYGNCLFMAAQVGGAELKPMLIRALPYIGSHICVLFLITYIPGLSLFIPKLLGLTV